jgi:(4-(4-[2-(gamma-L-glutamylamino)ethyl]phenoxymethyl)furan-2-yl)methanamine synthase
MKWLGLDIGGANIKAADGLGYAQVYPFALWREPGLLAQQIRMAIYEAPRSDHLVVTMTGELADCFESKSEGVKFILEAVLAGADNRHTRIYLVDGRLVAPQIAGTLPHLAAAANWHALAAFAGRYAPAGSALVIDVGSTTCDVIPLVAGRPAAKGATDIQRLLTGELIYTGVERSPLCAVLQSAPYRGQTCPVVQELFATMADAYLILEELPEDPVHGVTADGRPATRSLARIRLARMLAADAEEFNHRDAVALAHSAADAQAELVAAGIRRVIEGMAARPQRIILSGHGEFLARSALERLALVLPTVALTKELGPAVSRCAPAHAVAVLAAELSGK